MLPDPALLDSKSWELGVLPQMGPRLGIFRFGFENYPSLKNDKNVDRNYYPSSPLMTLDEWQDILNYYTATSPDSLPKQDRKYAIEKNLPLFSAELPATIYRAPASVFVRINEPGFPYPVTVSDAIKSKMFFFDQHGLVKDSLLTKGPIVNMNMSANTMLACNIGVLNPNNGRYGKASAIRFDGGKFIEDSIPVLDSLRRPVQITPADLNNDGKMDYLVCEFGNLAGELAWMENVGSGRYEKHVLRSLPGAIKAYVDDYNHDGLPDIWVLFAQADEGIFLFTNKGHGEFSSQEVLRFPPSYGSSYFELADFNKDGHPDIVYTCGDNADFSPVLKPYHGVYIFMNDGTNHFKQTFFFPINGCYKAIARDFDGDGDLDIATISFFADYAHQPEEGFVYLENRGDFDFRPYSLPAASVGRWLAMDAGDVDGDGRIDLVLGNFSIGPSFEKPGVDWKKSPPYIILKNTGKMR